jgi:hypothetical protein
LGSIFYNLFQWLTFPAQPYYSQLETPQAKHGRKQNTASIVDRVSRWNEKPELAKPYVVAGNTVTSITLQWWEGNFAMTNATKFTFNDGSHGNEITTPLWQEYRWMTIFTG